MTDSRPSVLVIEDDPGVGFLQRRRLERAGYRVEVATDSGSAMERLAGGIVDVVVMDYRLGTTTGLELHRRMKAVGFDLPVILVSAAMSDSIVMEAIRAGIRDVVPKETSYLDQLSDVVGGVINQGETRRVGLAERPEGACVLVVEDDPGVATLHRRRLERTGYEVLVAATADEAMRIVHEGKVNLAILDLRLPGETSGLDLYEEIRRSGWSIPAIVVTAFPDQAAAIRALRAGIRDFVPKSGDYLDHLPAAVDRVLAQSRVERKLVESELRLASIIGTTMDAILLCDEQLRIALFNPSAEEMFACTAAEAVGRPLAEFVPGLPLAGPADAEGWPEGEMRLRREADAMRPDGEQLPIEVSISDVIINGRRLFTVIARDIRERRRIDVERRERDRRKDEFLGMLAHELRNPLAAITNAAAVLERMTEDPSGAPLTAIVLRQARALARMVDDLLDVSRVTHGKIRLSSEPLLLNRVVEGTAGIFRDLMDKDGLAFRVEVDSEPLWVCGDAIRLEQVLANLLNNAVKFTGRGRSIVLSAGREADRAVIRVRDSGAGIDPDLLPHVFDLFVQAENTLERTRAGLGIGLALVRQIVSMHGGEVSARSDGPDTGSEFIIHLPLTSARHGDKPEHTPATEKAGRRLHVLVVDDQRDVADMLSLLVRSFGCEVTTVYGAEAALDVASTKPPDVMLVDLGMPGITGYDLARRVRGDQRLAPTRLIALTGYGRDEDRARVADAGFDLHLIKPVPNDALEAVLARFAANPAA